MYVYINILQSVRAKATADYVTPLKKAFYNKIFVFNFLIITFISQ